MTNGGTGHDPGHGGFDRERWREERVRWREERVRWRDRDGPRHARGPATAALGFAGCLVLGFILLIATLGVMVGFCALLVPGSGALGAAWALVWGSVVQMLGSVLVLRRARPIGGEAP